MKLYNGDCLDALKTIEENSIDAVITDPPYGLSFMGKHWDYDLPSIEIWKECLRVLKPGGYLLSFGGSRTYHRMAVSIEDAGFEIRDMIEWVYGSGFPKSLNIGKAVDKLQGNEREIVKNEGERVTLNAMGKGLKNRCQKCGKPFFSGNPCQCPKPKGTFEWEGWGTALKPAHEPICMARKPLSEKTIAENCLRWGTGGININGCRVETEEELQGGNRQIGSHSGIYSKITNIDDGYKQNFQGRFPANLIHDGSDEVLAVFPESKSVQSQRGKVEIFKRENSWIGKSTLRGHNDSGSTSRFFYCAKASRSERNEGCESIENEKFTAGNYSQSPTCKTCNKTLNGTNDHSQCSDEVYYKEMGSKLIGNNHPTVKPVELMKYLCRLVTPKGGTILDPFMGSGTTGKAAIIEGFNFIGIERELEYFKIAEARINSTIKDQETKLFK